MLLIVVFGFVGELATGQQLSRREKLEADRARVEADGRWIYNNLAKGFATANESNKPMMVVMRCVPCEECVKLDDDLVERNEDIRRLMDSFVCVRQVFTNGLDLKTFQFDTDQSFAVFFLNGDGTVYGRFGTRSHRTEWMVDVSVEAMEFAKPEHYPSLRDKYTDILKPGKDLVMDPYTRGTIKDVTPGSAAEIAGLCAGDELTSMGGQPLISIADIQWVLHQFPTDGGGLKVFARRDGRVSKLIMA